MADVKITLPALDWKVPMVDPLTGVPSPGFQRFWQLITVKVQVGDVDVSNKVDKNTSSGWSAATGTSSKAAFAVYTAPTISSPPTQAEVQAIAAHVQVLSQHLKPLIDAGLSSGLLSS